MKKVLSIISTLLICCLSSYGQSQDLNTCLSEQVINATDDSLTIADLKRICEEKPQASRPGRIRILNLQSANPFKPYKQNYIAVGAMKNDDGSRPFSGESTDLKFQFSMKYQVFQSDEAGRLRFLAPLHFAYTQKSWWDIDESSAPFAEHNYNPELFWEFKDYCGSSIICEGRPTLSHQLGFEHQSNGRDNIESRSWNKAYWQGQFTTGGDRALTLGLKIWNIIDEGIENYDIRDYLGNAQLDLGFYFTNRYLVELKATQGNGSSKVNTQVDLIYKPADKFNPRLFLSYYNGYGEALISYNVKTESLRLGFDFPID